MRSVALARGLMVCLVCAVGFAGCGDDDSKKEETPTGPELTANQELLEDLEVALGKSVALSFTGGGTVPGESGQILVDGFSYIFQDYSPDGDLVINGQLDLDILASPATLKGTIDLTGSMEYPVIVDMTIDVTSDPFGLGGTLTVDGEIYDITELEEEAQS